MADKAAATYHGADIVDRLNTVAPHTDLENLLREAANEIEQLRVKREAAEELHNDMLNYVAYDGAYAEPVAFWAKRLGSAIGGNNA